MMHQPSRPATRPHAHRRPRPWAFAPLAVLAVALIWSPMVAAQDADDRAVIDRLERLERDIRTLNRQISRGAASGEDGAAQGAASGGGRDDAQDPAVNIQPGEGATARIFARLDALEREVRLLTGAQESLAHGLDQMAARLDKLVVDLDYRLARLEGDDTGSFSAQARGETAPRASAPPRPGSVTREGAMPLLTEENGTVSEDGAYQPGEGENVGTLGTVSKSTVDEIVKETGDQADGAETLAGIAPADGVPTDGAPTDGADEPQTAVEQPAEQLAEPSAPAQPAQPEADSSILPDGTPEEQYRFAFDLTRQARYAEAEQAFKAFVEAHPDAELADNARYWLAETYYVRKRYMDAAQAFFDAYKQAPEGAKAPDSLLKLGMSMVGLDKPDEACATFGKLRKEFTSLKANVEQALNREVQKLDCK